MPNNHPSSEENANSLPHTQKLASNLELLNAYLKANDIEDAIRDPANLLELLNPLQTSILANKITSLGDSLEHPDPDQFKKNYQSLKTTALALEKYAEQFTKKTSLFDTLFGSSKRHAEEIERVVERMLGIAEAKLGSRIKRNEIKNQLPDYLELKDKIDLIIGKMQLANEEQYQDDIGNLNQQRKKLDYIIQKIQLPEHKQTRYYVENDTQEKPEVINDPADIDTIFNRMKEKIAAYTSPDIDPVAYMSFDDPCAKFKKCDQLEDSQFRLNPVEIYTVTEKSKVDEIKQANNINDDTLEQIPFKVNSAFGKVKGAYVAIINYRMTPDYLSDEELLIMAARFVLNAYSELPEEYRGRSFTLSRNMHPRFARAIMIYCDLSEEGFPRPNTHMNLHTNGWEYKQHLKNMDAFLRQDEIKIRLKSSKHEVISKNEQLEMNQQEESPGYQRSGLTA